MPICRTSVRKSGIFIPDPCKQRANFDGIIREPSLSALRQRHERQKNAIMEKRCTKDAAVMQFPVMIIPEASKERLLSAAGKEG